MGTEREARQQPEAGWSSQRLDIHDMLDVHERGCLVRQAGLGYHWASLSLHFLLSRVEMIIVLTTHKSNERVDTNSGCK